MSAGRERAGTEGVGQAGHVRALGVRDAAAYIEVRRRALETEPQAFASSPEEDVSLALAGAEERLGPERVAAGSVTFGAFAPGLVGLTTVHRQEARKQRHKAWVFGVYVAPENRRQGFARALMERAIAHAQGLAGVESLMLGVTTTTKPAVALYTALGFERYGLEKRALKIADTYYDEILMELALHD